MTNSKRQSLLHSIDIESSNNDNSNVNSIKSTKPIKTSTVKSSLYLQPKVHRLLKEMALAKDCKVHDLVIEGINHVLLNNGYPSIETMSE